jgi:hypothetical protein
VLSSATASHSAVPRPLAFGASVAGWAAAVLSVLVGMLVGMGWLYFFRDLGWFAAGPRVGESLPLLQLAGFDVQPLVRVVIAWLLAGALVGLVMIRVPPARRLLMVGPVALVVLLVGSQAAYSLTRNVPLSGILFSRDPGPGPLLEAAALALGCYLPRSLVSGDRERVGLRSRPIVSRLRGLGERGLGSREHRDAGQDDGDREYVAQGRPGV